MLLYSLKGKLKNIESIFGFLYRYIDISKNKISSDNIDIFCKLYRYDKISSDIAHP